MPNITKRKNKDGSVSYRIRVFVDDATGKQIMKSATWRAPINMRPTTAEKEAQRQATLFEEKVHSGLVAFDGGTTLGEYAAEWVKNAQIAPKTRERYTGLLVRIDTALGHIRLEKLQPHHLESFYRNLAEDGINQREAYASSSTLAAVLKEQHISRASVEKKSCLSHASVGAACREKHVSIGTAQKIAQALDTTPEKLFTMHRDTGTLAENTIRYYHALLSAVLSKAEREGLIVKNPARLADAPKTEHKEALYLTDVQAREFLALLELEPDVRIKTALMLLLFTGARRAELCGLSWGDIDEESSLIHIMRTSQYQRGKGITEAPTKNTSSIRAVPVPQLVITQLTEYRIWWNKHRALYGNAWKGQAQRLFIKDDGSPLNPDTINFWLKRFLLKNGLPHVTPHSLRHTFATLEITAGVDIRTLQSLTGHAQASTLLNIYSHALKSKQAAACKALEGVLIPAKQAAN